MAKINFNPPGEVRKAKKELHFSVTPIMDIGKYREEQRLKESIYQAQKQARYEAVKAKLVSQIESGASIGWGSDTQAEKDLKVGIANAEAAEKRRLAELKRPNLPPSRYLSVEPPKGWFERTITRIANWMAKVWQDAFPNRLD